MSHRPRQKGYTCIGSTVKDRLLETCPFRKRGTSGYWTCLCRSRSSPRTQILGLFQFTCTFVRKVGVYLQTYSVPFNLAVYTKGRLKFGHYQNIRVRTRIFSSRVDGLSYLPTIWSFRRYVVLSEIWHGGVYFRFKWTQHHYSLVYFIFFHQWIRIKTNKQTKT